MRRVPAPVPFLLLLLLLAPAALPAPASAAEGPGEGAGDGAAPGEDLTEEDIVRLWVAGTSAATLVETIGSSGANYALEPEMLDELRRAGLPEEVVQAMVRRQAAADGAGSGADETAGADAADPADAPDTVRVRINPDAEAPPAWTVPRSLPPQTLESLGVRDPEARVEDAAIFVACLDAPYVPDQWRIKTPLGRDFSMPRHRMLAFRPGGGSDPDAPLTLTLDGALEFELAEDPPWRLLVGVALRIGGRYYSVATDEAEGFDPTAVPGLDVAIEPAGTVRGGPPTVRVLEPR